jgi:hypothetical protein
MPRSETIPVNPAVLDILRERMQLGARTNPTTVTAPIPYDMTVVLIILLAVMVSTFIGWALTRDFVRPPSAARISSIINALDSRQTNMLPIRTDTGLSCVGTTR